MPDFLRWVLGGVIGGAIGAAIWAGVSYGTGYEIGWLAWGVGVLVGIGVNAAAGETWGVGPGATAAVIALASLAAGKYFAVSASVAKALGEADLTFEIAKPAGQDRIDIAISDVAGHVMDQWSGEGKSFGQVDESKLGEGSKLRDAFPPDVWSEAESRWEGMSPKLQAMMLEEVDKRFDEFMSGSGDLQTAMTNSAFKESFDAMDLLFAALAVFSAFKIASGATVDD